MMKTRQSNVKCKKEGRGNGCPLYKKCGGCQLQNMSYEEQLSFKQVKCIKALGKFGHVEEIIGMENPVHYRNKVQAAFKNVRGKVISGVYQSASHRVVEVTECMLEDRLADEIIVYIRKLLPSFKLNAFNEDTGRGFLRHVLVRRGFSSGQVMVVLVTGTELFPKKKEFLFALLKAYPEITTVVQNVNGSKTSMVLGKKEFVLYGNGYIEDTLCSCRFRISPRSFYQINPVQTEVLYKTAIKFAELKKGDRVLDAYCGTGTIGIVAAKSSGAKVVGVELNGDAVSDAIFNAKENNVENAAFYCADAGKFMVEAAAQNERFDVVFMDPPRAGSDLNFLKSIVKTAPKKVVYVSCSVETLERDLLFLSKNGYRVKKIQPVDMFPHTSHVETVCLLSKLQSKEHIEIEVKMDELDLTAAEKKATYEEIKAYVLEHTGLKVSHLYIAQVKQKCGIIERENYNKPKSENAKQPQCPPEKEKAIREALKHFGMI